MAVRGPPSRNDDFKARASPCFINAVYQMIAPIDKARGKGNCGGATCCGKEGGASVARPRTETCYKAGKVRREGTTPQSRSQTPIHRMVYTRHGRDFMGCKSPVRFEESQGDPQITFLSGEICPDGSQAVVAPGSRACPKAWIPRGGGGW